MLAQKMLFLQCFLQPWRIGINLKGKQRHMGYLLQNRTVMYRLIRIFPPGKWGMITYQYHFHFFVIKAFLESVTDYMFYTHACSRLYTPAFAMHAYCAGTQWPLESTSRSRSSHVGRLGS